MALSAAYELYRKLREQVTHARANDKHALAEALLLEMEELWWKIPAAEQELLETCPSKPAFENEKE
jgi:hypothetical protein